MDKGTEGLKQLLATFENMTVEEYETLYDEVCERYGDSEPVSVLDFEETLFSKQIMRVYNTNEDIATVSVVAPVLERKVTGYSFVNKSENDGENVHQNDNGMFVNFVKMLNSLFDVDAINKYSQKDANKVIFYVH